MSRIDKALKIWEAGHGVEASEGGATPSIGSSALNQYAHEEPNRHPRQEPTSPRSFEPARPFRPASSSRRTEARGARFPDNADIQARLVTGAASTASLEQYRRLAAVLHEEQVQRQLKTVMITSALPREGKTLTVVNLALTLSESYARRVLVIDADLRWPGLHSLLDIPNDRGLSEALRDGQHDLPFIEVSSRLSVLTAGKPGPNPLAGLASTRMGEVIESCATLFDWVLIDTSPIGVIPDAQVLARLVGAVILVIGAGLTPAAAVERAIAELGGPESIIGTVLNRVEERRIPEADYYGHYGTSSD
jgi:capsular exopolysaccharide synthesis family protein